MSSRCSSGPKLARFSIRASSRQVATSFVDASTWSARYLASRRRLGTSSSRPVVKMPWRSSLAGRRARSGSAHRSAAGGILRAVTGVPTTGYDGTFRSAAQSCPAADPAPRPEPARIPGRHVLERRLMRPARASRKARSRGRRGSPDHPRSAAPRRSHSRPQSWRGASRVDTGISAARSAGRAGPRRATSSSRIRAARSAASIRPSRRWTAAGPRRPRTVARPAVDGPRGTPPAALADPEVDGGDAPREPGLTGRTPRVRIASPAGRPRAGPGEPATSVSR